MASGIEPAKLLLPYLQRADELQKHEPLVAYYCRLYAMERGLRIPQNERTKTTNALLVSLMKQLEKDKKSLELKPDDNLHIEGFASSVFSKADKQDRAGRSDISTAKTFYAASIFFETLNQFGQLQPDLEQKQKYAAWKAADIRKALKEGRKPIPGPPGGDADMSEPSSTYSGSSDLEPSRSYFPNLGTGPDLSRVDSAASAGPASDSSPDNLRHSADFPQPPQNVMVSPASGNTPQSHYPTDNYSGVDPAALRTTPHSDPFPQTYNHDNFQHFASFSRLPSNVASSSSPTMAPPSHYPENYSSENIHQPLNGSEHSIYDQQSHQHLPYRLEPQHMPQHYPSHDIPPDSYPNFQSYPSFRESSLPAAPHHPSHYQGFDAAYTSSSPSNTAGYNSTPQYSSGLQNGKLSDVTSSASEKYEYDSSYQPPPEKIADAHKAARFAVGALAFDEVSVAVEHLKKSLELLTNPSYGH